MSQTMRADYGDHSTLQVSALSEISKIILPILIQHIDEHQTESVESFHICDIGSATGENSLTTLAPLIQVASEKSSICNVYFADLPWNSWPKLYENMTNNDTFNRKNVFTYGIGKSFLRQLVPENSLDIVFSASTFHWIDRQVDSKYIQALKKMENPNCTFEALPRSERDQFYTEYVEREWNQIVEMRHAELKKGGLFACVLVSQSADRLLSQMYPETDNCWFVLFEPLNFTALHLLQEAVISQEEYDRFIIYMWARTPEQNLAGMKKKFNIVYERAFAMPFPFSASYEHEPEKFARGMCGFCKVTLGNSFTGCLVNRSEEEQNALLDKYIQELFNQIMKLDKNTLSLLAHDRTVFHAIVGKKE